MKSDEMLDRVGRALSHLPDESGGMAIVLATAGSPPAMALLSSGDVHLSGEVVRVGVHASGSTVERLGGSFTLLVPLSDCAVRLEVGAATAIEASPLAILEGQIEAIRPTAEPPWVLRMGFDAEPPDHHMVPDYVQYWGEVNAWLGGEQAGPPSVPSA